MYNKDRTVFISVKKLVLYMPVKTTYLRSLLLGNFSFIANNIVTEIGIYEKIHYNLHFNKQMSHLKQNKR